MGYEDLPDDVKKHYPAYNVAHVSGAGATVLYVYVWGAYVPEIWQLVAGNWTYVAEAVNLQDPKYLS